MIEVPKMEGLTFDERSHIYKLNGLQIPSVTTVMRPLSNSYYGGIDENVVAAAGRRGTAVHQAIENHLKFGITDIPPEHEGYFKAFLRWMNEQEPQIAATEGRVYHKILRYAGTADILCVVGNEFLICLDFKTSSQIVDMLVRVQLEAYARAFESHRIKVTLKQVIHLQKDGTYRGKNFPGVDNEAWEVFCGLLTVQNYLKSNGRV